MNTTIQPDTQQPETESDDVLKRLDSGGLLIKQDEILVLAAAISAASGEDAEPNLLVCNRNYCLVVKD